MALRQPGLFIAIALVLPLFQNFKYIYSIYYVYMYIHTYVCICIYVCVCIRSHVAYSGFELMDALLPQPSKCRDYKCAAPCLALRSYFNNLSFFYFYIHHFLTHWTLNVLIFPSLFCSHLYYVFVYSDPIAVSLVFLPHSLLSSTSSWLIGICCFSMSVLWPLIQCYTQYN